MSSINRDPSFNTHKKETRNRMKTNKKNGYSSSVGQSSDWN